MHPLSFSAAALSLSSPPPLPPSAAAHPPGCKTLGAAHTERSKNGRSQIRAAVPPARSTPASAVAVAAVVAVVAIAAIAVAAAILIVMSPPGTARDSSSTERVRRTKWNWVKVTCQRQQSDLRV